MGEGYLRTQTTTSLQLARCCHYTTLHFMLMNTVYLQYTTHPLRIGSMALLTCALSIPESNSFSASWSTGAAETVTTNAQIIAKTKHFHRSDVIAKEFIKMLLPLHTLVKLSCLWYVSKN